MGLVNEVKTNKFRAWKSLCAGLTLAAMGFSFGVFGPTMLDLQLLVNTTVDQITHILAVRAFGCTIGSVASGFLLQYMDQQIGLMGSLLLSSTVLFIIPFCRTLNQLFFFVFFNGFTSGFAINCGNIFILHQWGKENAPFMQLIHFAFGLGAFIAPFIAGPFLKSNDETKILKSNFTVDLNSTIFKNQLILKETEIYVDPESLEVKYVFFITSFLNFLIFVNFLITYFKNSSNKPHPTRDIKLKEEKIKNSSQEVSVIKFDASNLNITSESIKVNEKPQKQIKNYHKYVLVILACIFMHLIFGLEISFGLLLPTFAVKSNLHMSKATASYTSSLYWGCFTFSRLFTMVMVNYFTSRTMLIFDLSLIMIGNFILLPYGCDHNWALLLGSAFMGSGVSSGYPTWWCFMEQIMPVTSKITAIVTVFANLGEFVLPVLIGNYIETWPMFYIYLIFVYSLLASISFALCCCWEFIINKYKNSL